MAYSGCGWSWMQCSSGPLWKNPVALMDSSAIFSRISIRFSVLLEDETNTQQSLHITCLSQNTARTYAPHYSNTASMVCRHTFCWSWPCLCARSECGVRVAGTGWDRWLRTAAHLWGKPLSFASPSSWPGWDKWPVSQTSSDTLQSGAQQVWKMVWLDQLKEEGRIKLLFQLKLYHGTICNSK